MFNQRSRSAHSFSYNNLMSFKYSINTKQDSYLYLMVSKKYGSAVKRNQLKRWVRVLYGRALQKHPDLGLMVRPLAHRLTFQDTQLCFQKLLFKLKELSA